MTIQDYTIKSTGARRVAISLADAPRIDVIDNVWTHPRGRSVGVHVARRWRYAVTECIVHPLPKGRLLHTFYGTRVRIPDGSTFGNTVPVKGTYHNIESVA